MNDSFINCSAYHILGKPDPAIGGHVYADAEAVQGFAGQVNIVPAGWSLGHHAFLHGVDMRPGRVGWPGQADALAAVGIAGETFVGYARALIFAVGAGMAEAAVVHVPAMQERARGQGRVPRVRVESQGCPVLVDLIKKFLRQL